MFEHLDSYESPILTDVARPVLITGVSRDAEATIPLPFVERWPPANISLLGSQPSLLTDHCAWLAEHLPEAYVGDYYVRPRTYPWRGKGGG
jgi:hypothetical protein